MRYPLLVSILFYCTVCSAQVIDTTKLRNETLEKVLATIESDLGYEEEIKIINKSAKSFKLIDDLDNYIFCQTTLAVYFFQQGRSQLWNEKMLYVNEVLTDHEIKDQLALQTYLNINTRYLLNKGEFSKAIEVIEKLLTDPENLYTTLVKVTLLEKLAEAYMVAGEYTKAKEVLIPAIAELNDDFIEGRCLAKLARIAFFEEDYNTAFSHVKLSLEKLEPYKAKSILSNKFYSTYCEKIEYLVALDSMELAAHHMEIANSFTNLSKSIIGKRHFVSALYYLKKGHLNAALEAIKQASEILREETKNNTTYQFLTLKYALVESEIFFRKEAFRESELLLRNTLKDIGIDSHKDIHEQVNKYNYNSTIKLLREIAYTKIGHYKSTEQKEYLDEATAIFRNIFYVISFMNIENTDDSYIGYWAQENQQIYEEAIEVCMINNDNQTAISFIEENKSNLLSKAMDDKLTKIAIDLPDHLQIKELDYISSLRSLKLKLWDLNNNEITKDSLIVSVGDQINAEQLKLDSLYDLINENHPEYLDLKFQRRELIDLEEIQAKLNSNSALIEYFLGENNSYVAYITNTTQKIIPIIVDDSLRISIYNFSSSIRDKSVSNNEFATNSKVIYNSVLKTVLEQIDPRINNLIIVPDNILINLPFENLLRQTGDFMFSNYNIQYQYSAKLWLQLKSILDYDLDFIGYAYNQAKNSKPHNVPTCIDIENSALICSNKEIEEINNYILRDNKLNALSDNSSDFLQSNKKLGVIHLATHTCLDNNNVYNSQIFLGNKVLTVEELSKYSIATNLIVLSSCESGYGKVYNGEGALSIAKAFFQAGAKSAVVSLWPVDDCSTADIMKYFYKNLLTGKNKAESLTNAKKDYLATAHPSRTHPYFWAGFVLIGNADPVWPSFNYMNAISILIIFIILIFLLTAAYKKRK